LKHRGAPQSFGDVDEKKKGSSSAGWGRFAGRGGRHRDERGEPKLAKKRTLGRLKDPVVQVEKGEKGKGLPSNLLENTRRGSEAQKSKGNRKTRGKKRTDRTTVQKRQQLGYTIEKGKSKGEKAPLVEKKHSKVQSFQVPKKRRREKRQEIFPNASPERKRHNEKREGQNIRRGKKRVKGRGVRSCSR